MPFRLVRRPVRRPESQAPAYVMSQSAPPRTSRSVSSDTAGPHSSPTGLASEKPLSRKVAPGQVARCTAPAYDHNNDFT